MNPTLSIDAKREERGRTGACLPSRPPSAIGAARLSVCLVRALRRMRETEEETGMGTGKKGLMDNLCHFITDTVR